MSIVGVGTDLVAIHRIAAAMERHGERFARRVLADAEVEQWLHRGKTAAFLAKRFAAKEALSKALGCGIGAQVGFHDIHISSDGSGAPALILSGAGLEHARSKGVVACHLSLSDERDYALAYVVLEGRVANTSVPDQDT
ncbi:holo-[acyl-carrier protein] synthase [Natronocella acetinitrilica]|uniref:Holo-[acyl-carrier-protein] synthase n=1 Tax=Natronocella acetinitrilica TaxID=414046 RepID=A0AAE3G7N6_9GAMM|nr:holo-ACP synthase [Natronocella acetinitrilica]MCP1675898.1 holo-[acyl-carrier protein] synthase [Natronocella acetinitrilica]